MNGIIDGEMHPICDGNEIGFNNDDDDDDGDWDCNANRCWKMEIQY